MRVIAFLIVGLLCSGCDTSTATGEQSNALVLNPCPGFAELGKPPIVHRAECGSLSVAEDPQNPNEKKISLNILRLPAVNPAPKADPLFIIAGGPGQSAVSLADQLFYVFEEVRKNRDIIFVDQRGTGKSQPLNCSGLTAVGQTLTLLEQKAAIASALRACVAEHGERLEFYTTPYAVRDLEAVRLALGYKQVNLWGVSYGTRVAMEYMRRYPQAVRTSVLDGVAPADMALPWSSEGDAFAALEKIHQQCAESSACTGQYGNVLMQSQAVAKRLGQSSIPVEIEHPSTRLPYRVDMNQQLFASAVRMALYSRDLARILPLAVQRAYVEDYQLITALISMAENRGGFADISLGMHYTVLCTEDYPQYQMRNAAESKKFLQLDAVQSVNDACELWPRYSVPEDYLTPVRSDVPTLLLSGARDPVTPPYWAEKVMQGFSRAKHGVAPGGHHSITRDGCTAQLIAQFIHTGNIEQLDIGCINKILPLQPYYGVDAAALEKLKQDDGKNDAENFE